MEKFEVKSEPVTVAGVYETLSKHQKDILYRLVGSILETGMYSRTEYKELVSSLNKCDQVDLVNAILKEAVVKGKKKNGKS